MADQVEGERRRVRDSKARQGSACRPKANSSRRRQTIVKAARAADVEKDDPRDQGRTPRLEKNPRGTTTKSASSMIQIAGARAAVLPPAGGVQGGPGSAAPAAFQEKPVGDGGGQRIGQARLPTADLKTHMPEQGAPASPPAGGERLVAGQEHQRIVEIQAQHPDDQQEFRMQDGQASLRLNQARTPATAATASPATSFQPATRKAPKAAQNPFLVATAAAPLGDQRREAVFGDAVAPA